MPLIRSYPEAIELEQTDAFVIDRLGTGTMFIEAVNATTRAVVYVIDGGGGTISTGVVGDLYIPFAGVITSATLLADQVGSVVVDIWSAPFGSYPPTIANTIVAGAPPTISSSDNAQDLTLTGWTTALPMGNTLRYNVNSVTSITRLTVTLGVAL